VSVDVVATTPGWSANLRRWCPHWCRRRGLQGVTNRYRNTYRSTGSELAAVELVDAGTVAMNADQYDTAVRALAALIETWHASQYAPVDDVDGPRAA
jgi:hypothetical protein